MSGQVCIAAGVSFLFFGLAALPASAQQAPAAAGRRWTVEVHGGWLSGGSSTGGDAIAQFPVGPSIPTGGATATTRAVSSWYFGDGAALVNQVNQVFNVGARIAALDGAVRSPLAARDTGGSAGLRVSRRLTRRLSAEFSVDYGRTPLRMTQAAEGAVEAARSSFIPAWNGLLATGATSNRTITSTADLEPGSGHQVFTTGAVAIALGRLGRVEPYATLGAGAVFNRGTLPQAVLRGNYRFTFGSMFPFDETDVTTVRVGARDNAFVGVFGGGFACNVSPRHGLRVDLRLHVGRNAIDTLVDANPSTETLTPAFAISTGTTPSVQFSTLPSSQTRRSSLSGPVVDGLKTFTGSGRQTQVNLAVGYFVRF